MSTLLPLTVWHVRFSQTNQEELILNGAEPEDAGNGPTPAEEPPTGSKATSPDRCAKPAALHGSEERFTKPAVLMLLAGVLKYNSSLKTLQIRAMDLDDTAATNFHHALRENVTLEHLDITDNFVSAPGSKG